MIRTLFVSNSDIGSLYEEENKEINSLYMWFCANKLSLNAKKTKIHYFDTSTQEMCS